jgi:hypothetical protein
VNPTVTLNKHLYRGWQGCLACKTPSEKCVLEDYLASVLESLKKADITIMFRRLREERHAFQNMQ